MNPIVSLPHGNNVPPITEDDIANYLTNTPDFFERHAEILATIQIASPHGNRAVSLQERQVEMLREKIKTLEQRVMEMIRNSHDNLGIADRMHRWAVDLLEYHDTATLPQHMTAEIETRFQVPQVSLRIWDTAPAYAKSSFVQAASDDARAFASSLSEPFCGANVGVEAVEWLSKPLEVKSIALLPLRAGPINLAGPAFGLLVMGSPDPERFDGSMGTEFLERMAELASAALSRLR